MLPEGEGQLNSQEPLEQIEVSLERLSPGEPEENPGTDLKKFLSIHRESIQEILDDPDKTEFEKMREIAEMKLDWVKELFNKPRGERFLHHKTWNKLIPSIIEKGLISESFAKRIKAKEIKNWEQSSPNEIDLFRDNQLTWWTPEKGPLIIVDPAIRSREVSRQLAIRAKYRIRPQEILAIAYDQKWFNTRMEYIQSLDEQLEEVDKMDPSLTKLSLPELKQIYIDNMCGSSKELGIYFELSRHPLPAAIDSLGLDDLHNFFQQHPDRSVPILLYDEHNPQLLVESVYPHAEELTSSGFPLLRE